MEIAAASSRGDIRGGELADDDTAVAASSRSSSQQPNERLLSNVRDLSLANRLLNVRIYQVLHASDCVGYRVTATDEGDNDYALFVSRPKGEQLYNAVFAERTDPITSEAVASSILNHLDIVGNRHRDVGRLICREPQVAVSKKERVAPPPKTPSKQRNAHLPTRDQDKRTSRNKQTQQRTHEAIAASHELGGVPAHDAEEPPPLHDDRAGGYGDVGFGFFDEATLLLPHNHFTANGEVTAAMPKSRKTSEQSLLHRMANADATTLWRSELGVIGDEADEGELVDEEDDVAVDEMGARASQHTEPVVHPKRVVPERNTKHKQLQQRRDKERDQRLHVSKSIPNLPSKDTSAAPAPASVAAPRHGSPPRVVTSSASPPRPRATSHVAATAVIGNAHALRTFVGSPQPEQEQFLRRKTTLANERRVLKTEGVFDDSLGVEITHERPDHGLIKYAAPGSPVPSPQRRTAAKRRSKAMHISDKQTSTSSASTLKTSFASTSEPIKIVPRPEHGALLELVDDEPFDGNELPSTGKEGGVEDGDDGEVVLDDENQAPALIDHRTPRDDDDQDCAEQANDGEVQLSANGATDNELPSEELLPVLQLQAHVESGFTAQATPRSSRLATGRTIHIVEEREAEETRNEPPSQQEDAKQQADSYAPPRPEEQPQREQVLPSIVSPRVECWENEAPHTNLKLNAVAVLASIEVVADSKSLNACWGSAVEPRTEIESATRPAVDEAASAIIDGTQDEAEATASFLQVEPLHSPVVADDPIVEIEPLKQSLPIEPTHVDSDAAATKQEARVEASPSPSKLPKRSAKPPIAARRASIVDVHASAIAAAAAAAAVTATTTPPPEELPPRHSPKSATKRSKRRSHDGIGMMSAPSSAKHATESRRETIRRSTLHGLPSVALLKTPTKGKDASAIQGCEAMPDDRASSTMDTIEATPPSTAKEANDHDREGSRQTVGALPSHHEDHSKHHHHHHHQQLQHHHDHHLKRTPQETEALQQSPGYYTKWEKWKNGKQLLDKVSCLQLEETLMEKPHDGKTLVKLGLRYARWPATCLAAALLLEHASGPHQDGTSHTHEYWNSLGNAHFDVFLRHRKFLPIASFHLARSMQAFTRAFAYLESLADPLQLLRYAICLYWKKADNNANLERADDILRDLFVKFATFCDHDRGNLLFLHFQILCRLKMFGEAIECLSKIMTLHDASLKPTMAEPHAATATDSNASTVRKSAPTPYDRNDYLLMLMHCQQASGDFLQSSVTFTQLLAQLHTDSGDIASSSGSNAALDDHDYLRLWGTLADKCFAQEDYALAIDFYGLAATYAKDSRVLARMLYNHALCLQAMGDPLKCNAEFKRAKNLNRHVLPFATLAEIHARYDDTYATLLRTPVDWIIEEVRQTLYERAASTLQRLFRRKKHARGSESVVAGMGDAAKATQSGGARASMDRRRQSTAGLLLPQAGNPSVLEETEGDPEDSSVVVDSHEEFLKRHAVALKKLEAMRARLGQRSKSFHEPHVQAVAARASALLSPWKDRPDLRRKHSMDSFVKHFGYVPGGRARYGAYWELLVVTALDLYETRKALDCHLARIRSTLPLVSEAVVCCALADALGNVDVALERLHDSTYEHELQLVSGMLDIRKLLQRRFNCLSSDTTASTRFPPIVSPAKTSLPPTSCVASSLPNKHDAPLSSGLPLCSPPQKTVRLSSLIDGQFTAAIAVLRRGATQEQASAAAPSMGKAVDRFGVLDDFRQVNASLLHGWQR